MKYTARADTIKRANIKLIISLTKHEVAFFTAYAKHLDTGSTMRELLSSWAAMHIETVRSDIWCEDEEFMTVWKRAIAGEGVPK